MIAMTYNTILNISAVFGAIPVSNIIINVLINNTTIFSNVTNKNGYVVFTSAANN